MHQKAGIIALWLAVVAQAAVIRAEDEPAAQTLLLTGRYEEAAEQFAAEQETDAAAAIGLARTQIATGKRDEAHATLEAAADRFENSADIQAELALGAFDRGEYEAAGKYRLSGPDIG